MMLLPSNFYFLSLESYHYYCLLCHPLKVKSWMHLMLSFPIRSKTNNGKNRYTLSCTFIVSANVEFCTLAVIVATDASNVVLSQALSLWFFYTLLSYHISILIASLFFSFPLSTVASSTVFSLPFSL